jgi:hypothetical protein
MFTITVLYALVLINTQEIHSQIVTQNHHVRKLFDLLILSLNQSNPILVAKPPVKDDPCNPSPCGPNAQCNNGICTCFPEYQGDAYRGCRPECVLNSDCPRDKSCRQNKCYDPCPGTCGQNAICDTINHIPMCSCPQGMAGNAFVECRPYQCMYLNYFFIP